MRRYHSRFLSKSISFALFLRWLRKDSSGFILLPVLIFMQIFFLISVYGLLESANMLKLNQHFLKRDQMFFSAYDSLTQAEKNIQQSLSCVSKLTSPWTWLLRDETWWRQHACTGQAHKTIFYYLFESLGINSCQYVAKTSSGSIIVADYKRLTVFIPQLFPYSRLILQSTFILPFKGIAPPCNQILIPVKIGRQMQRIIE